MLLLGVGLAPVRGVPAGPGLIVEVRMDKTAGPVRAQGLPLPVFSFHTYGDDTSPAANARLAAALRALLDREGFAATALWNSEWQGGADIRRRFGLDGTSPVKLNDGERRIAARGMASYALACKAMWQDSLDGACYYMATRRAFPWLLEWTRSPAVMDTFAVFPPASRTTPLARQERWMSDLASATPVRCAVTVAGAASDDLFVLAGRSAASDRLTVLVASLATAPVTVSVDIADPGPDGPATWKTTGQTIDGDSLPLPEPSPGGPSPEPFPAFQIHPVGAVRLDLVRP